MKYSLIVGFLLLTTVCSAHGQIATNPAWLTQARADLRALRAAASNDTAQGTHTNTLLGQIRSMALADHEMRVDEVITVSTGVPCVFTGRVVALETTGRVSRVWRQRTDAEIGLLIEHIDATGDTTNIIRKLAEAGRICAVFKHQWRDGRPGEGEGGGWYADYHPGTWYRTCRICSKCESSSINDWK